MSDAQFDSSMPLAGKVALITGASSGIGRAIAVRLAGSGASVALSARRATRLDALCAELGASGAHAIALPADVTDAAMAADVVEQTIGRFGRLDIVVNSAGVMQTGNVEQADVDEWRRVWEVNLLASLSMCKAAIPWLKLRGGDIVNISSSAARRVPGPDFGPYATSKHAVAALTEGLRQEVGGHGIRVCAIEPGATTTDVAEGIADPTLRDAIRQYISKDGAVLPEDIAAGVLFVVTLPARANVPQLVIRPTADTNPL